MTVYVLFVTVCFLAYANGANDNFKGVATLFGSGTANYRRALGWASLTTLAGSLCALFLAQTLLIKFTGKGLASDALIQSLPFLIAVAGGAGMTVILATRLGFPISTTHALVGAMTGGALLATWGGMNFAPLLKNFVLPLLLSPVVALLLAVIVYGGLRKLFRPRLLDPSLCLCVEQTDSLALTGVSDTALAVDLTNAPALSLDRRQACDERKSSVLLSFDSERLIDGLHYLSAGAVCFARGLNDTPKIAALLLLAPGFSMKSAVIVIAVAMLLGGLINARRVAETMSHKITAIDHQQGLSANLTTAFLVIFASRYGLPVSTTHVAVGSLFGIGLTTGRSNQGVIASIVMSWLLTLPCAAVCAAAIYVIGAAGRLG